MKRSDYIPLATTSTAGRSASASLEDLVDVPRTTPQRGRLRRRVILGSGLVIVLLVLYYLSADLLDDDTDDFLEDPDFIPEFRAAYLPFESPDQSRAHDPHLAPTQELPDACRDAYFSSGALCFDPELPMMDVVWTWVNGSDSLLQAAKLEAESRFSPDDPYRPKSTGTEARQYRYVVPRTPHEQL